LNAKFEESYGEPYHYNLPDKSALDKKPPSAIKITKVPKKGRMKTKSNGFERIVEVGDIVPAEAMDNFVYDQETHQCTSEKLEDCQDDFSYIPLSSW